MGDQRLLAKWSEALCGEDVAQRDAAAERAVRALGSREVDQKALLSMLQQSWWPLTPSLIWAAVCGVLSATRGLALDAHELEDASLLLGNLCREEPATLPLLEKALTDASAAARKASAGAIGRVGPPALKTLPALIACLSATEDEVGSAALESLGALGSLAPDVIAPALLTDASRAVGARRYLALAGLRSLLEEQLRAGRTTRGVEALETIALGAMGDDEAAVKLESVALVGMAKPGSADGVMRLCESLGAVSPDVAAYAAIGLLRRNAETERAVTTLAALLMSPDPERNGSAMTVLDGLETSTLKRARVVLADAARSGPEMVRDFASELLNLVDVQQLRGLRVV